MFHQQETTARQSPLIPSCCLLLIVLLPAMGRAGPSDEESAPYALWGGAPIPGDVAEIPFAAGLEHSTIHQATENGYRFLHGAAIAHHNGVLYANWANSPTDENGPLETLQGRRSTDGGRTWSALEVIGPGFEGAERHSHGVLFVHQGVLWTICSRFGVGAPGRRFPGLQAEAFVLDETSDRWLSRGVVMENCWPYDEPIRVASGHWLTGGQDKDGLPVVAVSRGEDLTRWDTVPIPYPERLRPRFAETTVWAQGDDVLAVIRGGGGVAWVSRSQDGGRSWCEAVESNLPMPRSKAYLGKLSTGQLYLLSNLKNRDTLVISVTAPGEEVFRRMWRIRHGKSVPPRFPGRAKGKQWSYPYGYEHDGKLYVVYSVGKENCDLSTIPLTSLAVKAPVGKKPAAGHVVTQLEARYRNGQVFLTWNEAPTPPRTTFDVYSHDVPITRATLTEARRIGHHVERHSARDWWQDVAYFTAGAAPGSPRGFVVATGEDPLDPHGGLFVHTIDEEDMGPRYYAVMVRFDGAGDAPPLRADENSLVEALEGRVGTPRAVWIDDRFSEPAPGSAAGKGLVLVLHGRGGGHASIGRSGAHSAFAFGDARQGWREGLPYKFRVDIEDDLVFIRPYDCTWVGREVTESIDPWYRAHVIVSWWYGYDRNVFESIDVPTVAPNYSEERLLYLMRWAEEYLGTDARRVYLRGGSMGGSGAVSMAMHYPERFAAVQADVPIVAYTRAGKRGSLWRLECVMGPLDAAAVNHDGVPLLEHMNGTHLARTTTADLPPFFMTHGRRDRSIPWVNNPPFYRAMNEARQSLTVYWDNGGHSRKNQTPDDVKAWRQRLYRFRLDESFLVFTNASHNQDPGNGDPSDGDLVGGYHRGLDWKDLEDTEERYSFTLSFACPSCEGSVDGPIQVDVTPRRVQRFRCEPGDTLRVTVEDQPALSMRVDAKSLFTVPRVVVRAGKGTTVVVTRGG